MQIDYMEYLIQFSFETEFIPEIYPMFLLRSILGNQLHSMYCINKDEKSCENCLLNSSCGYALLFETILDQNNNIIPGRVRGCHPFVFKLNTISENQLCVSLILVGNFTEFFEPIIEALEKAGESGIGKNRVKFVLSILNIKEKKSYELIVNKESSVFANYAINLKSPLRLVVQNKPKKKVTYLDFISAANRRLRQILMLYGNCTEEELKSEYKFSDLTLRNVNCEYLNLNRWSSRQKRVEPLGGIIGTFDLCGNISSFERQLIEGAEIFSIGKNTNFGLGNIECLEKMEE